MTLILDRSVTVSSGGNNRLYGVEVKSHMRGVSPNFLGKNEAEIRISENYLSMGDFEALVMYVMINTDLEPNDPRRSIRERIANLIEAEGYNGNSTRFVER